MDITTFEAPLISDGNTGVIPDEKNYGPTFHIAPGGGWLVPCSLSDEDIYITTDGEITK